MGHTLGNVRNLKSVKRAGFIETQRTHAGRCSERKAVAT
jgi:hypothetical protein